jgi:DNA topoisomerase-2
MSKEVAKEVSSKYKVLTDVEHVLHRPSTYIGSTKQQTSDEFVYENNKIQRKSVTYNPAFLKIFDEILTNAVDESKRNKNLNTIVVSVTDDTITVKDNGGIPVIQHTQHKKWIPELIFSQLRSGSNFDDSEDRVVAGTNGLGSTLTNIFSKTFIVKTADGQKQFLQTFSDNMSHRSAVKITESSKNFTEISYVPDFKYFGLSKIDEDHYLLLKKRVLDIAACNVELKITFNDERFRFKSFKEYADLYVNNPEDGSTVTTWTERSENWEVAVGYSAAGYETISFVNSNETKDGGTHVSHITNQIVEKLRFLIKKKHKVEIKPGDIKNHIMLFVNCTIINPSFSSQTKEKLITEPKDFGSSHEVSDKLIKNIFASEVVASILDWIQRKQEADLNSKIRKLNKDVSNVKILKLIDAKARTHREQCSLGLFEGDSALSAVRKCREPNLFGAFPLRGKFLNVNEMKTTDIIKNEEVKNLMGALGLKFGEKAENLRYGRILFYVDADPDGTSIASLLTNFFYKFWPELFTDGRIYKVMTPLVVAKNKKDSLNFYTMQDFEEWASKTQTTKWSIEYKKGLAALEDTEYEEIIENPFLLKLTADKQSSESLDIWFGDNSNLRKDKLINF